MRDARDPEREFTKNTRHVFFIAFTSSSSFVVVVVVFVADDDDDDETVADGETTSSIGSPSSALRARSEARTKTQREKQKREKQRERRRRFVGLGFSRASLCVCACAPLKAFNASCNCHNVTWSFPLAPRADIFWFPRLIKSIRHGVRTRALRSPTYRNKAEL